MTITFDGFERGDNTHDIDLDDTNVRGLCLWNDIWRVGNGSDIKAFTDAFAADTDNDLELTGLTTGEVIHGLTTDGTNLIALTKNDADERRLRFIDSDGGITATVLLSIPTGYPRAPSIAYDLDNSEIWIAWNPSANDEASLFKSYSSSGAELTGASASFTGADVNSRPTGMVWWNGYLIAVNTGSNERFFVYNLSNNSQVTIPNYSIISSAALGKKDNTVYVLERGGATPAINDWGIDFTDSDTAVVPDAPTGLTGTTTSSTVSLTWDDPDNDTITGYEISRKTGSGSYSIIESDTGSDAQSYADTTVSASTTYTYKIQAINTTGNSADSNEFEITTYPANLTLTDIVANTANNFELVAANTDPEGLCLHQNYWRSVDTDNNVIYSYLASDPTVTLPTIALHSDNSNPQGITSDGTYMYVANLNNKVFVYDANGYVRQFDITLSSGYNPRGVTCDVDNNRLWVLASNLSQNRFYAFTIPESGVTTVAPISSLTFDGVAGDFSLTFQGIIFFEGYLVTINGVGVFYAYNTADNSLVSGIDLDLSGNYYGLGRNGDSVYASPNGSDTVQAFTLVYTSATLDTTAPTFEVDDNDADYATTVVFGGTYTVGIISDISETGTTSVIDGDDDVDTSVAGEYTVTYTVTDEAGNSSEIVETVTVSEEIILDTTAPTFQVDDNTTDYATTVAFEGTYTVGVISDISETGTTSVITGDDDVDTSTAGEYTVTYTVTDAAGNSTEIVETVTVAAEVITDSTAPTILSGVPASADVTTVEVSWRVTFSEDVQNVDRTDFGIKRVGVANFDPHTVTQISASIYDVFGTLPEPDVYHLRLRGISDITDLSGNSRTGTGEISGSTITYTAPVTDITAPTFEVDGNSIDFATTVAYNGVYTVGVIAAISEVNTTSVITGDDNVDTSVAGDYTVTYTVTDAAGNASEIVETVTVSAEVITDTTTPTFTITASGNDYTADFATTVAFNGVYTVGAISGISETSDGGVVTGASAVDTSVAGEYTVTYTVTDTAGNAGIIVETVTVSAEVITTGDELLTFTDNAEVPIPELGQSHYTERTITIPDTFNGTISSLILDLDITHPAGYDIRIELESPDGTNIRIVNYDTSVHLLPWDQEPFDLDDWNGEMTAGVWTLKINDGFADANEGTLHSWELRISTDEGLDNGGEEPPDPVDTTAPTFNVDGNTINFATTVEFNGTYTVGTIADISEIGTTSVISGDTDVDTGIAGEYTVTYTVTDEAGNATEIVETVTVSAEVIVDTTAPTFQVDSNAADYATTVVFGGTYTVGVISDISETGTTSAITGDDDVDTSVAGEYTVTYTVTDTAGNVGEIVETITVSAEIITATVPDAPEGLGGTQTYEEVTLTWDDPSNDTITGYKIYRDGVVLVEDTGSTTREYVDDTVAGNTEYVYKIAAINDEGTSDDSSTYTITTDPLFTVNGGTVDFDTEIDEGDTYRSGITVYNVSGIIDGDIVVKDSSGTVIASINNTEPDAGSYTIEYSIMNVPNNPTVTIIESLTVTAAPIVPDTTAPTFTVKDNSADFDITIELGDVYNVGTFEDIVDEDASPEEDIVYKNSAGTTITSFDGDELAVGTYSVEYTLTDDANNATTIIESITVEDTTAPTFEVDDNTVDYTTELTDAETYEVGTIDNITDDGITTTSNPVYKDSTGAVISSFDNTMLSAGDYSVEYTVTDDSNNAYTIIESITVTETETTGVILTGLTRNSGIDFNTTSIYHQGFCKWNGYWRSLDWPANVIKATSVVDGSDAPSENISIPNDGVERGLTTDGTNLIVLVGHSGNSPKIRIITSDKTISDIITFNVLTGTGTSGLDTPKCIMWDIANSLLWIGWGGTSDTVGYYSAHTKEGVLQESLGFPANSANHDPSGGVWWNGYLITVDGVNDRFFIYKTSTKAYLSSINPSGVASNTQGLGISGNQIYLGQDGATLIRGWNITFTGEVDTTDPTFQVNGNSAAFITFVAQNGVYAVGVISDISEVNTTSTINGNSNVNTSMTGDYLVTYRVTDSSGNYTEIVETVRVIESLDMTAPTFLVDENNTDFTTNIRSDETYVVKAITDIASPNDQLTEEIIYKDGDGNVINSFNQSRLNEELYFVEYTVRDESNNIGSITETIVVEIITTIAVEDVSLDELPATSAFDFKVKWKNHYEVLQQIALNSGNDLWFEGSRIFIGTKGKLVNLQREDKLYKSLISKINLDTYANIVNVIGAKSEGENLHGTLEGDFEKTRYKYEKVISNNNLDTQEKIDTILPKLVKEFASIAPDVDIGISAEVIDKYDLRSGDIIKLNSNTETQNILGYYRIISLVTGTKGSGLKLQFSRTGKFIPRIADSIDIFEALLLKMKELEINS